MIGSLLAGVAFIVAPLFPSNLILFTFLFGIVAAFAFAAMTYVSMGILVDRLVSDEYKAFAYAIVTNGTSIGFIVLSPLWIWLQGKVSWMDLFLMLGLIFLIPLSLGIFYVSKKIPLVKEASNENKTSMFFLFKDYRFYILCMSFISCGATMAFVDVHLVAYWQDNGVNRLTQASSLSTLGVLELFSGLLAGWLATKINKGKLLAFFYIIRSVSVCLLLVEQSPLNVYLFAALFGASYLGTVVLTTAFCFEFYGDEIKGRVFGLIFLVHQIGALLVTQLGSMDFDLNQSYQTTIMVLIVTTAVAAVLALGLSNKQSQLAQQTS